NRRDAAVCRRIVYRYIVKRVFGPCRRLDPEGSPKPPIALIFPLTGQTSSRLGQSQIFFFARTEFASGKRLRREAHVRPAAIFKQRVFAANSTFVKHSLIMRLSPTILPIAIHSAGYARVGFL